MNAGSQCRKLLTRKSTTMKFLRIIIISLGAVAVSSLYLSCAKPNPEKIGATEDGFSNATMVQVFDAAFGTTRNYVYVDAFPVSGVTFAYGGVFPATAYAFKVQAGLRAFMIRDTLKTSTQSQLTFAENMLVGKHYTIFMYDTLTSVKQSTVLNNIVVPADTTARLRFANFIYNKAALANVDVYSFRRGTTTAVFSNVPTTGVTDFIPYASGLTDTLYVYATGTTTPLLVKVAIPSLTPTRSYTAAYTGRYTGTRTISTFVTY